ncbi:hypothetical protein [Methylobacterium nigriterrae]|uniref:hypothetical protein n=1 Tax=Methylobacterium nigriterrae TaxID=3127512 RepID=UPI0030136342
MAEQLTGQAGRQGKRGKPALYVLVVSVGLMLAALVGLLLWQGTNAAQSSADQSQAASLQEITGSTSGKSNALSASNTSGVPAGNPASPQPAVRNP